MALIIINILKLINRKKKTAVRAVITDCGYTLLYIYFYADSGVHTSVLRRAWRASLSVPLHAVNG